ncbi:tRNA dimethylallyltransferase [Candidatus Parcubacteria bacterium]|nr:tRNA dimethylallyltransferase [Candidatus Parcubacteria bacterium]
MNNKQKQKIIVIVGTTASGKTTLAVDLAWKFNGEVVSADSRQVYKYMDVGTGKDLDEYTIKIPNNKSQITNKSQAPNSPSTPPRFCSGQALRTGKFKTLKIPYHCIDVVHPNADFNLEKWKKRAEEAIKEISGQGRVPIVAGGTGLYSQALVDNYDLSQGKSDKKFRVRLEKMSAELLFRKLLRINKNIANKLNESDRKNKRRLIRCLENRNQGLGNREQEQKYEALVLGITWPKEVLQKRILKRINDRLKNENMLGEVEGLHMDYKVSWKRLENFGLEYKYLSLYLQGEISREDMVFGLARATYKFSQRQMTWLRRWERQGREIHWVKNKVEARKLVKVFL